MVPGAQDLPLSRRLIGALALAAFVAGSGCQSAPRPAWEVENPIAPLPKPPLGITSTFDQLNDPPTPARVRLGRWLFYDSRLSADGTVSCGTCHRPDQGFSETERVATGVHGQRGTRKSPTFVNAAWAPLPHFFWDGRAASLEAQALGPVANPVEMGISEQRMVEILDGVAAYKRYFKEAFGDERITTDRVVKALADYERTRLAGNSAWDRWQHSDRSAVSPQVERGHALFFGRAACNQCHLGENFTDGKFHNLGVGWNEASGTFTDEGRYAVTRREVDRGAFKTPTLRDVSTHAPYMHDGSMKTLEVVVEFYGKGGTKNPQLSPKMTPLGLTRDEIDALVAFMKALDSDLPVEVPPTTFPR